MADQSGTFKPFVDADLALRQVSVGGVVTHVRVRTTDTGTLQFSASGKLPRAGLKQIRQAKRFLQELSLATGQPISVRHNDQSILTVKLAGQNALDDSATDRSDKRPQVSIKWWGLLKSLLRVG